MAFPGARILQLGAIQGQVVRKSREPGIVCHEVFYDSGVHLDRHGHESSFFALSLDGKYRESASGSVFDCVPRTVVFHPAGEEHSNEFHTAARVFVVELDPDEMRRRYDALPTAPLLHLDGGPMAALLASLYAEFRYGDACSSLAVQGLVLQLVAVLSRAEIDNERGRPHWLERVNQLLHDRFQTRLTLEEIASEIGVSPANLSALFRRFHHRSIAEEQRRLRVEFACHRLRQPDVCLAAVAIEAGFSDQPHFSRVFKQLTGMTPARYRSMFL